MTKTMIAKEEFSDVENLIEAIRKLIDLSGRHPSTVYLSGKVEGFLHNGMARLIEETLSDGSTVYEIELGEV